MRQEWTMIDHLTEVAACDSEGRVVAVEFSSFPQWAAIHTKFLPTADRRFIQPDEGGVVLRGRNGESRRQFLQGLPLGHRVALHPQPHRRRRHIRIRRHLSLRQPARLHVTAEPGGEPGHPRLLCLVVLRHSRRPIHQ